MNRRKFLETTAIIATGSVAILAGCASETGDEADSTQTKSPAETNTVQMVSGNTNYYFDPIGLFIEKGRQSRGRVRAALTRRRHTRKEPGPRR